MLKLTENERKVLDLLLKADPQVVAVRLKIKRQRVYSTKHYFRKKVQNAEEFLAVAKSKYKRLLKRRLKTPRIMPILEDDEDWWDE